MYRFLENHGLTFLEILGLIFIVLKLCKVIDWSWWLVLLPIYFPLAVVAVIIILTLLAIFIFG